MNPKTETQKIRVAAYDRFSTLKGSQPQAYTMRRSYYSDMISKNPSWTFTGLYADEGRGGSQFNKMMEAAEGGQIDYIITKSIDRFAGNTANTLSCVRKLREMVPPVGVFFETENLDSLDTRGELVLTILSAIERENAADRTSTEN